MLDTGQLYDIFRHYLPLCQNEEELREMFSLRILPHSGIPDSSITHIRHEYSVLNGRIDSLYGKAVLEFKSPGAIPAYKTDKAFEKIKEKMTTYIKGVSKIERIDPRTIIGIIFDGQRIAYQSLVSGAEIITGPYQLNQSLFKSFLDRLMYGLTVPKALTQSNLIRDFGLSSTRCIPFVQALYKLLTASTSKRTHALYGQWRIYFREICGYDFQESKNLRRITSVDYSIEAPDIESLTFSIHTYFSIILTLFAVRIGHIISDIFDSTKWLVDLESSNDKRFRRSLQTIFDGVPFKEVGFTNIIEPTFFQWFIEESNGEIEELIREVAGLFIEYSTETLRMRDIGESDILKDLYQSLSPPALRHALGEYYTPDWLADLVLERVGYSGEADSNVLDPTCGSGTFLIRAISKYKEANSSIPPKQCARGILDHVRGIDLNPLAVTASKINYLIAMGEGLIRSLESNIIEIPVFLSDAMLAPLEHKYETSSAYVIPTKVANFSLPKQFVEDARFLATMTTIEEAVREQWDFDTLSAVVGNEHKWTAQEAENYLKKLYGLLGGLEGKGLNGVWVDIMKNFFAPSFMSQVDYIVGNPPWVNWENLPESYRDSIKKYWSAYAYNLFRHRGLQARLGSAHDDICVLLTYIVSDVFLKDRGKIGFVLPQTLFKSKGGGEGFRAFDIPGSFSFKVLSVDDLNDLKAFDAGNKTSVFCAIKGDKTTYPVPYYRWARPDRVKISSYHSLEAVKQLCEMIEEVACPIDSDSISSPWLTGDEDTVESLKSLVGASGYRARKGVDTSLNAVFWVKSLKKEKGSVQIINCQTRSRSEVRQKKAWIEEEALFPLLRGTDFSRWRYEIEYDQILLYNQTTGKPLPPAIASSQMSKAWRYFNDPHYVQLLKARGIYAKHLQGMPIYSCYDIGPYSFSKQKVVWKALASGMQAVVIGSHDSKVIVPDHNVMMISISDFEEAHYLCAVLNSDVATLFVTSYIEWFFSTHILEYFNIPKWDFNSDIHQRLAALSIEAHTAAASSDMERVKDTERQINRELRNIPIFSHM